MFLDTKEYTDFFKIHVYKNVLVTSRFHSFCLQEETYNFSFSLGCYMDEDTYTIYCPQHKVIIFSFSSLTTYFCYAFFIQNSKNFI